MDRNSVDVLPVSALLVALRKESVDRNYCCWRPRYSRYRSLSARRAWIEMCPGRIWSTALAVALRKESVDRNLWWGVRKAVGSLVALRKESVDRNLCFVVRRGRAKRRSPQGERG